MQRCSRVGRPAGRVRSGLVKFLLVNYGGSDRIKNSTNLFCLLENVCAFSDPNLSMLTRPCNVQFTMFYFTVHHAYFTCMLCLQDFIFLNNYLTALMLYLKIQLLASSLAGVGSDWKFDGSSRVT